MHSLNGYLYGNLMGLDMTEGDRVRWHVAAYGGEVSGNICGSRIHGERTPHSYLGMLQASYYYCLRYVFARYVDGDGKTFERYQRAGQPDACLGGFLLYFL